MSIPRRCNGLIFVILTEIKQSTAGAYIPRFSTPESRLYLACAQAVSINKIDLPGSIQSLLEPLADNMDAAREASERHDIEAEREHVRNGLDLYRQALNKIDELGIEEPQTLTVTFNNLVRRHDELNPKSPHR
jgi:hypothetical protein